MSKKLDYMLDKMNQPKLPKYIIDLMIENGVHPSQTKIGGANTKPMLAVSCRSCGEPLDDDNIYGQCEHCYFRELNGNYR